MSYYKKQELDFVCRTKEILKQYDRFQIEKSEKYEVTLLLNCLVGLLILPQQYWYDSLPEDLISEGEWGIHPTNHISMIKGGETKNVKNIARHLRNSVAHYKFTAFDKQSKGKIRDIKFEDLGPNNVKTFEAIIPISGIKQFTTKLTDTLVAEIERGSK